MICTAVWVLMHCVKGESVLCIYSIDATPPKQRSRYVDETSKVDLLVLDI